MHFFKLLNLVNSFTTRPVGYRIDIGLVCKLKTEKVNDFFRAFKKSLNTCSLKRICYVIRQSMWLVINPISVDNFAEGGSVSHTAIHFSWLGRKAELYRFLLGPSGIN